MRRPLLRAAEVALPLVLPGAFVALKLAGTAGFIERSWWWAPGIWALQVVALPVVMLPLLLALSLARLIVGRALRPGR